MSMSISSCVTFDRSRFFGRYWRISPLAFSLLPRCQLAYGSQKYDVQPIAASRCSCQANSLPLSVVTVLTQWAFGSSSVIIAVLDGVPGLLWCDVGVARAQGLFVGSFLGEFGIVASAAAVVGDLAVHGALVEANTLRNSANGKALGQANLNLVSLI